MGLLVTLLQIWLEGADARADQQTGFDLQICSGRSIV